MLELYQFESCPFCRRVRDVLCDLEIDYICRNVQYSTEKWAAFEKLNPEGKVPFLVDPEKQVSMGESKAIIEYIKQHYSS